MALPQPHYICGIFAPLHLAHGTETNRAAKRLECCMDIPGPGYSGSEQRDKERRHDIAFAQCQNADHKYLEDDYAPNKSDEGERPCLALRFVGLIEYWSK